MSTPQVLMIIYLTLGFILGILAGINEKDKTTIMAVFIKTIFLTLTLYSGGFWN